MLSYEENVAEETFNKLLRQLLFDLYFFKIELLK
jgi:hypothetical protein